MKICNLKSWIFDIVLDMPPFFLDLDKKQITLSLWTPGLHNGVHSNHPFPWSVHVSTLKYPRDSFLVFSEILHEIGGN